MIMNNPFETHRFRSLPKEAVELVYRNPRIQLPFDPEDVAVFLDREHGDLSLRTLGYHHRSADLGVTTPIRERNRENAVYTQIDLKGIGFLYPESHESKKDDAPAGSFSGYPEAVITHNKETSWGYDGLGLMDARLALRAASLAHDLSAAGMRTEAFAAVMKTKKVFIGGDEVDVDRLRAEAVARWKEELRATDDPFQKEELRAKIKDVREAYEPAIAVRLVRSVLRLRDLKDADPMMAKAMMLDACQSLNVEMEALGSSERFDVSTEAGLQHWAEFVSGWFARNVGIMHGRGQIHQFLHMGNLTLAGEVVDLDSVASGIGKVRYQGLPEVKAAWDAKKSSELPFFRAVPQGGYYVGEQAGHHRGPDDRFGLPKCIVKDLRDVAFSMRMFLKEVPERVHASWKPDVSRIATSMVQAYLEGYGGGKGFEAVGVSRERISAVFEEMCREVVERGKRYPPIPPDGDREAADRDGRP